MTMTPDAKRALSRTIRGLRTRLLDDLHKATESAYRLSLAAKDATLSEAQRVRRERLETWIDEQVRALPKKKQAGAAERFRLEVEKDAAATLLQRLVFLRLLEAGGLRAPHVVTGGWDSAGYKDFRALAPELAVGDDTEGYQALLGLVFDELAVDLPGLFGDVRLTGLVPVPAKTLRAVVEALDAPELESCWTDDMTLGWIYQYWNDPVREALDEKILARQKLEHHDLPPKTQMFTDRYLVEWLLQNSLGPTWLAMCKKHGWTPEAEANGTLARLEQRRADWRAMREAGEVELTALMPLESDAERRWAYYVPQPLPDDAVEQARDSVRDLKILDPAVGSGHFLVVAFDLLAALYREEARHRGQEDQAEWSERAIVERILEDNLHGIDLDPRAVQIAAAALWLKAQQTCREARPRTLNLVASNLRLSSLPADDPARRELAAGIERDTGIPVDVTQRLLDALAGADHLGSLLKVDAAVNEALRECEQLLSRPDAGQGQLFDDPWKSRRTAIDLDEARATLLSRLELFLHAHSRGDDLGLKLKGEQLAAGVRFVRLVREGRYDIVTANPPYQGTSKMADSKYVEKHYALGKADLFAAFLLRSLELVRAGGVSSMLSMRNWMFIKQYAALREHLLGNFDIRTLGDFDKGAFEGVTTSQLVSVCLCVIRRTSPSEQQTSALQPTAPGEKYWSRDRTDLKRAAVLCQRNRYEFDPAALKVVPEWPLVYWWSRQYLSDYDSVPKLSELAPTRVGMKTSNNQRFVRKPFELHPLLAPLRSSARQLAHEASWVPYVQGAAGKAWFEPLQSYVLWRRSGFEIRVTLDQAYGMGPQCEGMYFRPGVAFSPIGSEFTARVHRYPSIFSTTGTSVFPKAVAETVCLMNSSFVRGFLQALNPTIHFEVGDVNRLPVLMAPAAQQVFACVDGCFAVHESHREPSVEFKRPGPSPWRHAQDWAQLAVDRPEGEPLPPYVEELDPEPPTDHVSFALGVALGRFGAGGEGILDPAKDDLGSALPAGICFLDGSLDAGVRTDSLGHPGASLLHDAWAEHGDAIDAKSDLRTWLRLKFFKDVHKGMYESRPIYFPLSSAKKTFVAHVSIHRWDEHTLRALLAEHLHPSLARFEGELSDLREARQSPDKRAARAAEDRYGQLTAWKEELEAFMAAVEQCAEKGPPPPDSKTPERETDARYAPDLDDGVMINSAALWPLLEPQWKDPKKWWKELATAKGKKDYDWSHLAARYFPTRVDAKCQTDPSLAVAHGCFWKYHPETAYRWELRLQDEIAADFTLDEQDSDQARAKLEAEKPELVEELVKKEQKRREAKRRKQQSLDLTAPADAEDETEDPEAAASA